MPFKTTYYLIWKSPCTKRSSLKVTYYSIWNSPCNISIQTNKHNKFFLLLFNDDLHNGGGNIFLKAKVVVCYLVSYAVTALIVAIMVLLLRMAAQITIRQLLQAGSLCNYNNLYCYINLDSNKTVINPKFPHVIFIDWNCSNKPGSKLPE